jgi:hypothetical protein
VEQEVEVIREQLTERAREREKEKMGTIATERVESRLSYRERDEGEGVGVGVGVGVIGMWYGGC